jgi:DeoR/GlpR family transcriptional regulator of sugar metabolism
MKQRERLNLIMQILDEKQNASTKYLCKALGISESTVRRDIEFLASIREEVEKVHGGVVLSGAGNGAARNPEYMFDLKLNLNNELKKRIAKAVVGLLEDNDSILLDSGTTCLQIATELHRKRKLRIACVDLPIAMELAKHDHIESIIIGGLIRPGYYTIGDSLAIEMLQHFSIEKLVMSADAIDFQIGITNFSVFEVGVKRQILKSTRTAILAADYTKFGTSAFHKVANLAQFSTIVTNTELEQRYVDQIREAGIELLLV